MTTRARLGRRLRHRVLRHRFHLSRRRIRGHRRRPRQTQDVVEHRPATPRRGRPGARWDAASSAPRSTAPATSIRRTTARRPPPRAASRASTNWMAWSSSPASTSRRTQGPRPQRGQGRGRTRPPRLRQVDGVPPKTTGRWHSGAPAQAAPAYAGTGPATRTRDGQTVLGTVRRWP
jgi:hypothetical protein